MLFSEIFWTDHKYVIIHECLHLKSPNIQEDWIKCYTLTNKCVIAFKSLKTIQKDSMKIMIHLQNVTKIILSSWRGVSRNYSPAEDSRYTNWYVGIGRLLQPAGYILFTIQLFETLRQNFHKQLYNERIKRAVNNQVQI